MNVDVIIYCNQCGSELSIIKEHDTDLYVAPCNECLEEEFELGKTEGREENEN